MLLAAALFVQPSDKVQISPSVSVQPAHRTAAPRCDFDRAKSPILPYAQGEELTYLVSVQEFELAPLIFGLVDWSGHPMGRAIPSVRISKPMRLLLSLRIFRVKS